MKILDFLKSVMNNVGYEIETRKDAAKAMLPYMHQKKGEGGKKDAKAEAAKKRPISLPFSNHRNWWLTIAGIHNAGMDNCLP